jgi:hypothetical protein
MNDDQINIKLINQNNAIEKLQREVLQLQACEDLRDKQMKVLETVINKQIKFIENHVN